MKNPSLTISRVEPGSPEASAGIRPGDRLEALNGHAIRDIIDFHYYAGEGPLTCVVSNGEKRREVRLETGAARRLDFEPFSIRRCGNHCVFCFVDQNPEGLRNTLYIRDEDYRLSFLHGNYITLTRIGEAEIDRILSQRLSPLYVSIHALDTTVRKRLLGLKKDDHVLQKIKRLLDGRIELHGQIVLCPGFNDGPILQETIDGLAPLYPGFRTLAVVPVGLTRHRSGLEPMRGVSPQEAGNLLRRYKPLQKRNMKRRGEPFLFFSDEFYLMAGLKLPRADHYGAFYQIENGVGLTRAFLDCFREAAGSFPSRLKARRRLTLVTGRLAQPVMARAVIPRLRRIRNLEVSLIGVDNRFYGASVTVAGLLSGQDIQEALQNASVEGLVLLPPACLNDEGKFLDNRIPAELEKALNIRIHISEDWNQLMENLQ